MTPHCRPHRIAATAAALAVTLFSSSITGCFVQKPPATGGAPTPVPLTRTLPKSRRIEPLADGAYLGGFVPPSPFDGGAAIDGFEKLQNKSISIVMWYQPWSPDNRYLVDPGAMVAVWRRGKVPMITWEPWDSTRATLKKLKSPADQPTYRLSRIVKGDFDPYIRSWAKQLRKLGGPVMIRLMHEMNGTWYPWCGTMNGNSPALFKQAWRHVHDIFEKEGATNVTWVWSVNAQTVPDMPQNQPAAYYPGDAYVDWTAVSGFNWGKTMTWSRWGSFSFFYTPVLTYLHTLPKPIAIGEFGCVEQGGNKAIWLRDAYQTMRSDPKIKAIVYFETVQGSGPLEQKWSIVSSPRTQQAFQQSITPSYFNGGKPSALTSWVSSLPSKDWQYLMALPPVY